MSQQPALVIGVFGFGTVGGGVIELLRKNPLVRFKCVCVRDPTRVRDVKLPSGCRMTTAVDDILNDEEINCVVEVMGGTTLAWEVTRAALEKGLHVVSANKALIAKYMDQIAELLKKSPSTIFKFEAAVCGGIPIIRVMQQGMQSDKVDKVVGILNGTTNFILSAMEQRGAAYADALTEAQDMGYAEADPSADVEGWDARAKLCILAKLAFGLTVEESAVHCQGISRVTDEDFAYAKMIQHTIKLLGIAERVKKEDGSETVSLDVSPVMAPMSSPIVAVDGAKNVVQVDSRNLGSSWYIGPGAGRFPTANSVVSDVLEVAERVGATPSAAVPPPFPSVANVSGLESDYKTSFFLRLIVDDHVGIIHSVSGLLAKHGVSIFSILQTPITNPRRVPFAIVTEKCCLSQVTRVMEEMKSRKDDFRFVVEEPFWIRYLE